MSFQDFFNSLPFPDLFSRSIVILVGFLLLLGIYKFVKDWLPW